MLLEAVPHGRQPADGDRWDRRLVGSRHVDARTGTFTGGAAAGPTAAGGTLYANPAVLPCVPAPPTARSCMTNDTRPPCWQARDPGLPTAVANDEGWVVTGSAVVRVEPVLATHNMPIGPLRRGERLFVPPSTPMRPYKRRAPCQEVDATAWADAADGLRQAGAGRDGVRLVRSMDRPTDQRRHRGGDRDRELPPQPAAVGPSGMAWAEPCRRRLRHVYRAAAGETFHSATAS